MNKFDSGDSLVDAREIDSVNGGSNIKPGHLMNHLSVTDKPAPFRAGDKDRRAPADGILSILTIRCSTFKFFDRNAKKIPLSVMPLCIIRKTYTSPNPSAKLTITDRLCQALSKARRSQRQVEVIGPFYGFKKVETTFWRVVGIGTSQRESHRKAILQGLAFLSRIFWGPDPEFCDTMIRGNSFRPFETLSPIMYFDQPGTIDEIAGFISGHADPGSLFQTLEESYVRLFISNRGGISTPLYQSCYTDPERPEQPGPLMGPAALDMRRRLESAGLSLDEKLGQMPDHLSVEIEYLYFLLQEPENREDNRSAVEARAFAGQVMLPWVRKFRKRLGGEEENRFYLRMADLLVSLLTLIFRLRSRIGFD